MARLVAVDYDPFASQSAQPRLTPVDYDPFAPTLNARASGSAGAVNKKAEAIWGGSFDDWKKRKEADDAERARMVAESEAGNVGSRRAQDFQRKVAALNKEGDQTGDYSADSLRAGRSLEMGMEQGREQIGAGLQFAGETPLALADFFGRIRPKGETEQDRSNPVTEAGKDIRGAAVARQQEIAPLMIDRPDSLLSMQGAKYIAQSALQSAPTTGTGLAAAVINPAAGLSLMGAGAGSAKFADARAEDKNYWLSAEAGAAAAAAEVVPEMLPLGFLSGRLLKHLPGTAMKRMASSPAGRGALLALSEGASEGVTELSNIAYEIAREGKSYSDDEIEKRLIDATAVGTVMGGGMAAVAEVTGQSARAYDKSGIADLELENSLRDAIKPIKFDPATRIALQAQLAREESARAAQEKTARILGPDATPDAAAGAQIADDAFRAAGVGTVAAADMAEQDALARDLDAAQRDQLGSEAEIDRLLTGGINAQAQARSLGTVLDGQDAGRAGAAIPGFSSSLPAGVRTSYPGDSAESGASVGFVGNGSLGSRDAPAPQQFTELANGTIFVPGDPVQLRQRAADAGFDVRGLAETRNGVTGVRFGTGARDQIIGLFGGADPASAVEQSQPSAPPEAAAVIAPPALDAKRTYGDTVFDERAHDLLDFIALNGGLDRTALESEGIDPASWNSRAAKGKNERFFGKPLFRKSGGMSLETLREKARDAGFRTDKDVLDLIGDSLGGRKTFTPAGSEYQMALADVARQEADAQARQQRVNALPPSVPETDADAYIASRETEFDAPADRDGIDLADIESTLSSVSDTSPEQRASTQSLGGDYTAKLLQYKKDRRAWGLNPQQEQEYQDLLELDRETGKVGGRPMVGVRNKTAYVDALDAGELLPVQGFTDADDFKTLNDKLGHAAGDDAIREIGDALVAEFGEGNVFHRSGDEFLFQGTDQADVDAKMQRVRDRLSQITLRATDASGNVQEQRGIGLSYGTGTDEASADAALVADKQRRKESGQRVGQRRTSDHRGVGEESAGEGIRSGEGRGDSAAEGVGDARRDPSGSVPSGTESAPRVPPRNWLTGQRTADQGDADTGNGQGVGGKARPSVQSIRAAISAALGPKFLARLDNQKWFQIVDSVADLPPDVRKSITGGGIAGFVLGNRVFVVAEDAAGNPVGVLLHELGVHYGMTGILGEDFAPTLAKFKRLRAKDDRVGRAYERATDAADKDASGELTEAAKATLDEEALAYFVEENWDSPDTRGIIAKVIDAIKSMLNRLGIPLSTLNASPEMLRKVAIGAARKAADGRVSVGKNGVLRYHKAWHGSPHDFDKFRYDDTTSHTGEGAQAYGAGLYFAGNQEVAEHYRKPGPWSHRSDIMIDGVSVKRKAADSEAEKVALNALARTVTKADAIDYLQQDSGTEDAVDWIVANSARITDTAGRLYEVELAPNESDYLDWDAPLSEQSAHVRDALEKFVEEMGSAYPMVRDSMQAFERGSTTGASLYRALSQDVGSDAKASADLKLIGIPGIRYLDGSSRGKGEGSRNFVIFDDSQVEVKAKYSRRVQDGRIRKTVAELTNAADSMGSWRDWYDRHDQTLRDVFGDDAELFQKLLSATSQAASVPANVGLALKAYRQLFSGEPFTGYLPAVIKNLERVAENVALRGQKISEYGSANEGNADAIAVDRHIAMLFFGTKSPNRKQVAAAKNRIRAIAERLGWQPREVQAALWAYNQTLLGTAPENVKSYDKLIEASRARIDALRASIGRGEDRGAREVGGTDGRVGAPERDTETDQGEAREVAVKYSRKADGGSEVAESDKLVALHNVSPEGLLFADKIGGLAVPSIGITKAATPFTGFGSVTLIGSRDLATPSGDNPVFSADAFTQRFPDVEWPAVAQKKASELLASLDSDYRRRDTGEVFDALVNKPDRDEAIRLAEKSAGFMRAWLEQNGESAPDVMEVKKPREGWMGMGVWLDAVDAMRARGVDVRNIRPEDAEWAELSKVAVQAIKEDARESSDGNSELQKYIVKLAMDRLPGGILQYATADRAISFALGRNNAPNVDRYATRKAMQDQIGDRMPQFSAWVASKIAPLFGEPSIRIGRKKVPMTLENVVEAMTTGSVAGKEKTITFGTGKAKAMNAKQYRTLEEIQADRAKIVAPEVEKDAIAHTDKLLDEYRTEALLSFGETNWQGRIDTWAGLDAATKALADAAKKAATPANVRAALVRNGFRMPSPDAVRLGVESLIALRETVTDYFEAKPQRAVKLSEFAGAVVRESEADQVRPVLEKHGVEVREYSGEDADRRATIDEFTKELESKRGKIRFSRRAPTITIDGTERPTTDSTGKAIHPTEEGLRNFWRWFQNSRVVDDQGRPLVVYHGTAGEFDAFDRDAPASHIPLPGFFFTPDADIAGQFADGAAHRRKLSGATPRTIPAYVSTRNPAILKYDDRASGRMTSERTVRSDLADARKAGHDGAIITGWADGSGDIQYVAFRPTQIKSADSNSGAFSPTDKRIAYSRKTPRTAEQAAALAKAGMPEDNRTLIQRGKDYLGAQWASVKELASSNITQSVFDRFHRMSAIEQDLGIPPERSAYLSARLAAGLPSIMEGLMMYAAPKWEGGVLTVDDTTVGLLDALKPVKDDINGWLGWMVGRRASALKAQGRENLMSDADIDALLSLSKGKEAEFKNAALNYLRIKKAVLDVAEQAGLIDPVGRASWDSVEYIPFYRQDETEGDTIGPGTRQGLSNQSSGIQKLKGGTQNLADPLGNIVRNFTRLIDASLKNNSMLEAVKEYGPAFFEKVPMSGSYERIAMSQVKKVLLDRGVPQTLIDAMPQDALIGLTKLWAVKPPTDDDVVRVMRDGKPEYYRVPDKDLLASLTAFKVPSMHWALSPFKFFKKLLTVGVTSSPEFMARNFVRDSLSSWVISDDKFRVGWDSVKGIISPLLDKTTQKEMMFAGGSFIGGQFYSVGSEEATADALRRALRDKGLKSKDVEQFVGTIARTPLELWDKWQKVGSYFENANRNAIYENAIKAGRSKKEAAYLARDLMDFSMHGNSQFIQFLSDVLPFFNARLQGLYKLYRQGGKKALRKALLVRAGTVVAGTLALMAWNMMFFADGYDELEEWDKDTYWHIMPGTPWHIRVPKPFELGVLFATVPERLARAVTYQVPGGDAGDRPRQTLDSFLTQVGGTLAMNPIPQGVMPIVEQWANKTFFTGRPIENMGDEKLLPEARAEWYTSDTARVVSDVIGNKTGLSPKRIEHLWNGYTGTVGAYALDTVDWLVRSIEQKPERPELAWAEMPLLKAFYRGDMVPKSTRYSTEFYEIALKTEQISNTIKDYEVAGQKDKARALEEKHADLLGSRKPSKQAKAGFMHTNVQMLNKAKDELAEIRKQIEGIVGMPGFSAEQKREKIEALAQKRNKIARDITVALRRTGTSSR